MQWLLVRKSAVTFVLFACASILNATPRLVLSASAIGPVYITPGMNGPAQTVTASNAGDSTILSLTTSTSATWLAASVGAQTACVAPLTGNCFPITISLNTAALAVGSYTEYVTVNAPATVDAPQQIPVSVVVANVPNNITLYVAPNEGTAGTASFSIYPQSAITSTITTQSGGGWLSIAAPAGAAAFGTPYVIMATSQPGQATGTYTGTVAISGSSLPADNQTINVTLNVTSSPIIQVNNQNVLLTAYTGGPPVDDVISFTNAGMGTLTLTGATITSSVNGLFSIDVTGVNSLTVTANPTFPAGLYTATINVRSNAPNSALVSIPVELTIAPAGTPVISQGGIVNIATYQADALAQGDIATIFGDQFTAVGTMITNPSNPAPASGFPPLETKLGGVQVLVNGVAAPLYFVSRQQINFQMPYEAVAGQVANVQVVVNSTNSNARSAQVVAAAPRILIWPSSMFQGNYGIVVNQDNTISLPMPGLGVSRPSHPGDIITIYGVGFGQTTPAAVTGGFATSSPLQSITPNATVTFGTSPNQVQAQTVYFTGLTPTAVGLYQIDVTIPANAPIGTSIPLQVNVNGASSNIANIAIVAAPPSI